MHTLPPHLPAPFRPVKIIAGESKVPAGEGGFAKRRLISPSARPCDTKMSRRTIPRRLAIEHRPADVVAQPLIIQHQVTDGGRQALALPAAFAPAGGFGFPGRGGGARGLDGVGCRAQLVGGHVGHGRRLGRGVGGIARRPGQIAGGGVGVAGGRAGLGHRRFAARPGASQVDGSPRPVVVGASGLEEGQYVLGAIGRPEGQPVVVGVLEAAAAPQRDKPGVSLPG